MRCSKAHKLMSPYMDRELGYAEREAFEVHLKECRRCAAELEALKGVHTLFVQAEKYSPPFGFATRVMATAGSGGRLRAIRVPLFIRFAEVVVVLAIISTGILSGTFLFKGLLPDRPSSLVATLSLDIFDPAPPDSPGGVYLAMTEERYEK